MKVKREAAMFGLLLCVAAAGVLLSLPPLHQAGFSAAAQDSVHWQESADVIDLNRATLAELCTLEGIGETRAQNILHYRAQHGGFSTVEELEQVDGISRKKAQALARFLTVSNNTN